MQSTMKMLVKFLITTPIKITTAITTATTTTTTRKRRRIATTLRTRLTTTTMTTTTITTAPMPMLMPMPTPTPTTTTTATSIFSKASNSHHHRNQLNAFIIGLMSILLICSGLIEGALRNVNLIIEPPAVRRGQHAILRCMYDLEGAPLYSAKFYRGQLEFYRYTPGEFPNTKVFPFPGIHVDVTNSNATQVLIRNVGFGLSGNFSCEVTADGPLFSTATGIGTMQVVELPDKRPQLFTEHTRYESGDILRANCSTLPSRPRAELKFTINNEPINNADTQYIRTIDNLIASRISLKLQIQSHHFGSANLSVYGGGHTVYTANGLNIVRPGSLILRCTAIIGDLYQEYKEIELGNPHREPVPARVTFTSGSGVKNFFSSYFYANSANVSLHPTSIYKLLIIICMVHCYILVTPVDSIYSAGHLFWLSSLLPSALSSTWR